jgi:assimilatory nitrate reductase catalytic subunit
LKGTPVRLTPLAVSWHGRLLRRPQTQLAEGPYYWARIPLDQGQMFALAGWEPLPGEPAATAWILRLLGAAPSAELITYTDPGRGAFRYASIVDDRLDACLLLARRAAELPPSETLVAALVMSVAPDARLGLLAGPGNALLATDDARMICVCFAVGLQTLRHEIADRGLTSLSEIGTALGAGTNCGSCIPELTAILRNVQRPRAAAS